jgi:hypothetical protein
MLLLEEAGFRDVTMDAAHAAHPVTAADGTVVFAAVAERELRDSGPLAAMGYLGAVPLPSLRRSPR